MNGFLKIKTNIFPQNRNQVINISREHNRGERGKTICISIFPPFGLSISHPGGPNGGCIHFNARYLMISQYVTLHTTNSLDTHAQFILRHLIVTRQKSRVQKIYFRIFSFLKRDGDKIGHMFFVLLTVFSCKIRI